MSGLAPTPIELAARIEERAARCGLTLVTDAVSFLAEHARRVMDERERLHLTSIREVAEFIERHVGESLEGAASLEPEIHGNLLDLGSGNGYPALPVAAARPGLKPHLAEASPGKATFLRSVMQARFPDGLVLARQIQRPGDLDTDASFDVITARAAGGWERILPRLATRLTPRGRLLVWAGPRVDEVRGRVVWRRVRLSRKIPLPGRERSWIWCFVRAPGQHVV